MDNNIPKPNRKNFKDTPFYQQYLKEIEQENEKSRKDIQFFSRKSWEAYKQNPCAKQSMAAAIGCGSIMAAHQLRLHKGNVLRAAVAATIAWAFTIKTTFNICEQEMIEKHTMIKYAFKAQNIQPLEKKSQSTNKGTA